MCLAVPSNLLEPARLIGQVARSAGRIYDREHHPKQSTVLLLALLCRAGDYQAGQLFHTTSEHASPGGYRRAPGPAVTSASRANGETPARNSKAAESSRACPRPLQAQELASVSFQLPPVPALTALRNTATGLELHQFSTAGGMPRSASCHRMERGLWASSRSCPHPRRPLNTLGRSLFTDLPRQCPASTRWLSRPRREMNHPLSPRLARSPTGLGAEPMGQSATCRRVPGGRPLPGMEQLWLQKAVPPAPNAEEARVITCRSRDNASGPTQGWQHPAHLKRRLADAGQPAREGRRSHGQALQTKSTANNYQKRYRDSVDSLRLTRPSRPDRFTNDHHPQAPNLTTNATPANEAA